MAQGNIDIIRAMYDAYSRRDMDTFLNTLHTDVEWRFAENFIFKEPLFGRQAVAGGSLRSLATEWEGFDSELLELIDGGDQIVGLGYYTGTYKPTGKSIRAQFAHIWTLAGGKVTRWRQLVDTKQFADAVSR